MSFQQAHLKAGSQPRSMQKAVAAGQSWKKGALLIVDANDQWAECGADPAAIAAVAMNEYAVDSSGFTHTGRTEFPPGYVVGVEVNNTFWRAKYVGSLPAAAGGNYGVIRDTDGFWKVDFNDAVNSRVKLIHMRFTAAPFNRNLVVVQFLPANVQLI